MEDPTQLKVESEEQLSRLEPKQQLLLQEDKESQPEMSATRSESRVDNRKGKRLLVQHRQHWITPIT